MNEWTQERKQKFWKECGFKILPEKLWRQGYQGRGRRGRFVRYKDPNGRDLSLLPRITDLNALVRWAMPAYVMKTGKDFMTIPTTLTPEDLAVKIAETIEKAMEVQNAQH